MQQILGIDVGGSGIKGALVNLETGELIGDRHRIPTPSPATPEAVAKTIAAIVAHFDYKGVVGVGFPAAIQHGVVKTASNIDKSFIDTNIETLFTAATGNQVFCLNDADAAGSAEVAFGAGKDKKGTVIMVTVGTGIGTAVFSDGKLLPNTEFGHIYLKSGIKGEHFASDKVRQDEGLKWKKWAPRFDEYLLTLEALLWPDMFILGGGVSKKLEKFEDLLTVKTPFVAAEALNEAGIIGAAAYAAAQA